MQTKEEKKKAIAIKEKELFDKYIENRIKLMNQYFKDNDLKFKDINVFTYKDEYGKEDCKKIKEAREWAERHPLSLDLTKEIRELHIEFCLSKASKKYKDLVAKRDNQIWAVVSIINEGLFDAIPSYDPSKNIKFVSFAEKYIKNAIKNDVALDMNVSPYYAVNINKYKKAQDKLIQKFGTDDRPLSDYEAVTGMAPLKLLMTQQNQEASACVSITDETVFDLMHCTDDLGNPEEKALEEVENDTLRDAIRSIPSLHREILCLSMGLGIDKAMTNKEIAQKYDMRESQVRKIIDSAVLSLRENPEIRQTFEIDDKVIKHHLTKDDVDFKPQL